jgi:hypothetical protein
VGREEQIQRGGEKKRGGGSGVSYCLSRRQNSDKTGQHAVVGKSSDKEMGETATRSAQSKLRWRVG